MRARDHNDQSPRATMSHLPGFGGPLIREPFQRFLTWLTGKPRPGDQPWFLWTPATRAVAAWAALSLGFALDLGGLRLGGFGLLLLWPGLVLTVGALRSMYLELAHAAVHGVFTRNPQKDRFVTEFFTTVTMTNHRRRFAIEHLRFHHRYTGSFLDVDYQSLIAWGFRPNMSRKALWRRLAVAIVSPRVHAGYLWQRIVTNFGRNVPPLRRLAAFVWLGLPLGLAAGTGAWTVYFVAWLLPLTYGYQLSSLLQMVGAEHLWGVELGTGKERIARQTYGRFLGDPFPTGRLAQVRWLLKIVLVHLPARVAVYIGHDLGPAHDMHHREPLADWANAPYVRQAKQDAGTPGWPLPYVDHWGSLASQIDRVFRGLASLPPMGIAEQQELRAARERVSRAVRAQ